MLDPARSKVWSYLLVGEEIKELKKVQEQFKKEMNPYFEEAATNSRGSKVIRFDSPIKIGDAEYGSVQKVRKETKTLNEEKVFEWLESLPYHLPDDWDLVVTTRHIDQDSLWRLFTLDVIDDDTFNSFFEITESWAFSPTKV